jgi:hypothetical protein
MRPKIAALLICSTLLFAHGAQAQAPVGKLVKLPDPAAAFKLNVLVVNHPRYPTIDENKLKDILQITSELAKTHFNASLSFNAPEFMSPEQLKSKVSDARLAWAKEQVLDLSRLDQVALLSQSIEKDLKQENPGNTEFKQFGRNYLIREPADLTDSAYAQALAATQAALFNQWRRQTATDGTPLLPSDGTESYPFWLTVGYSNLAFEVIVTNQPIISSEKVGNAVHSALRGGVSNGISASSNKSSTGVFSVLSLFPFENTAPATLTLRNNQIYSPELTLRYAAALLTHELGHQLFHLGHPFGNEACIMRPPVRLHFAEWYRKLDAKQCSLGSDAAMTPGKTLHFPDIRENSVGDLVKKVCKSLFGKIDLCRDSP